METSLSLIQNRMLPPILGANCWVPCLRCRMGPKGVQSCADGMKARGQGAGCHNGVKKKRRKRR
jgi:hypothetical protein